MTYSYSTGTPGSQGGSSQDYDWSWLENQGYGTSMMDRIKGVYSGKGGLGGVLGRSVVSDAWMSEQANLAGIAKKKENIQDLYGMRDRSDENFAAQQAQIAEKEAFTEQSIEGTQSKINESMEEYRKSLTGSGGYLGRLQGIARQGATAMTEWGEKAVATAEESREEFEDLSAQRASAASRGGAATLQARNAQLDASNMPENVKQSMRDLNRREFDQDMFSKQTELQNQSQQTRIGLDQTLTSAFMNMSSVEGAATQMETTAIGTAMTTEADYYTKKVGLDMALGAARTDIRKHATGMAAESHQVYAGRDLRINELIADKKDQLAKDIENSPVSLLDGAAGLAALYSSSEWAARRMGDIWVPGDEDRRRKLNLGFTMYNPNVG